MQEIAVAAEPLGGSEAQIAAGPVDIAADCHEAMIGAEGLHTRAEGIDAVSAHERRRPLSVHACSGDDPIRRDPGIVLRDAWWKFCGAFCQLGKTVTPALHE